MFYDPVGKLTGAVMSLLRRIGVPVVGGVVVLAVIVGLLHRYYTDPTFLPPDDVLQYWAAGRLAASGQDPYDAEQLIALQATAGRDEATAVLNWQPPWALAVCLPFGPFGPRTAQLLWTLTQVTLLGVASVWLWRLCDGPKRLAWVPLALALSSPGTMFMIHSGQCGGWLTLGVVGWFAAVRTGRVRWAALLPLCALKPHLFGPLWLAVAADALRCRAGRVRLGAAVAAGLGAVVVVTAFDPNVWGQYLDALRRPPTAAHRPLSTWEPPLIGFWLRFVIDYDRFAIQFIPTLLAAAGTTAYLWRRPDWRWVDVLPYLICLGLLAAPYSGWVFDLVLLTVPAVMIGARLVERLGTAAWAAAVWLAITAATIGIGTNVYHTSVLVWVTPAVLALVWAADRRAGRGYHVPGRPASVAEAAPGADTWATTGDRCGW